MKPLELALRLETEQGLKWLQWAIVALMGLAFAACIAVGANGPKNPKLVKASKVGGFGEIGLAVRAPGSSVLHHFCALLAETLDQRQRGLMARQDLAGYDAMVFRFPTTSNTTTFIMQDTLIPLSIVWLDKKGGVAAMADMDPCKGLPCHQYDPKLTYATAIEVKRGDFARLGIAPGAKVRYEPACTAPPG